MLKHYSVFVAAAMLAGPAFAQTAAAPAPQIASGATVAGPDGSPVGTIAAVGADYATVKTDRHEVRLPKDAFGSGPNGLVIGLSRDALNASVEQALAGLDQMLTPGSTVYGAQGATIGTVEAVENDLVTVKLANQSAVRLPKSGFAPGPNGATVGLTVQQLEAQASPAGSN